MKETKTSYEAPKVVLLQANFTGLLCVSGGASSGPKDLTVSATNKRYGAANTSSW